MNIDEIAALANVSKATVSLALNNRPGVNPKTRENIKKIAAEHKYTLRSVKQNKTNQKMIRFLALKSDNFLTNPESFGTFIGTVIQNIEKQCSRANWTMVVSVVSVQNFHEEISHLQTSQACDGTIILGTNLTDIQLSEISSRFNNFVILDNAAPLMDINTVSINNYQGGHLAAEYLLQNHHNRIAYIGSKERYRNFQERENGFLDALQSKHISPCSTIHISQETGMAQIDFGRFLSESAFDATAIFCESDYMAIGVMKALSSYKLDVPNKVSVIGFDDVAESTMVTPELTTVSVNRDALADLAFKRLHDMILSIGTHKAVVKQTINTTLALRNSVCFYNNLNDIM